MVSGVTAYEIRDLGVATPLTAGQPTVGQPTVSVPVAAVRERAAAGGENAVGDLAGFGG